MPTFVVIRRAFAGYQPGQVVDASNWRNRQKLIACRHVREASADEIAEHEVARVTAGANAGDPAKTPKRAKASA